MSEAIPSWARVGAKVVCVRDFAESFTIRDQGYRRLPVVNEVYVITKVEAWPQYSAVTLDLLGLDPVGYDVQGFRPLVSQADDIATFFAQHLNTRAPETV